MNEVSYRKTLRMELDRRSRKNPRYSMRRFAQAIEMDSGNLSTILSGKRSLGIRAGTRIASRLDLDPSQRRDFLQSIIDEKAGMRPKSPKPKTPSLELSEDVFHAISDWHHYGILQLCRIEGFQCNTKWISRQLSITETQAKLALDRLVRLRLLRVDGGNVSRIASTLDTKDKKNTAPAFRKLQRQVLEKAIVSLESDPIEERGAFSMALVTDSKRIERAKVKMEKFLHEITEYLEGGNHERVYHLHLNLYPVQSKEKSK